MSATAASGVRELRPGQVYALGGSVALDGRLSWAPETPGRFQTSNCYLLREGDEALMVDTGLPVDAELVLAQLEGLLEPGARLSVFITRPEMDCVGNLAAIRARYDVRRILAGGRANPFDAFDFAGDLEVGAVAPAPAAPSAPAGHPTTLEIPAVNRVDTIALAPERRLQVAVPTLRFLPTYWLFDESTGVLFTSDVFGHVDQRSDDPAEGLLDSPDADEATPGTVAEHLFCKFWWLPGARTDELITTLESIFETLDPEIVAPTHGRVIVGRDLVRRHLDLVLGVLRSC